MERHNNCDAENFFITASKEELIDYLVKKINSEVEKGDDADCDLIRECSDWLDELTEDEIVFTPEELERNLERIKAKAALDKPVKRRQNVSCKTFVRVVLIAAGVLAISLLSLSSVAANNGYDSTWRYIVDNVGKLLGMNDGENFAEDSISFIKYSETSTYSSFEDLLYSENINILYPKKLPEKLKIIEVYQTNIDNFNYILSLCFSDPSYSLDVSNYYSTDFSLLDKTKIIDCYGLECFITQKEESLFYALFQQNGYEYSIQSPSYDDLLAIIYNMKG